jgi:hypothetical protein
MKSQLLKKDSKQSFSYLAGINRPINPAQVTKLAQSVNRMGIIRPVIVAYISFIDGIKKPYIIDGQHLFNALIRNNMDIPYVVIEVKDKKDLVEKIALLNASSKNWSMFDYVTAWGSLNPDYIKLNHYYQVYDLELGFIAGVLLNNISTYSGTPNVKIKKGEFKISNEKDNVQILDYVTDMLKIVPRMNRFENKYVCAEYVKFLRTTKTYNHKKFIANLNKNKKQFVLATQEDGKLVELFTKLK